jgi:transposase
MRSTTPTILNLDMHRLDDVLRRAEGALPEDDYAILKAVVESYSYIADLVGEKNASLARLRKLLFGAKTEKTAAVLGKLKTPLPASSTADAAPDSSAATTAATVAETAAADAAKDDAAPAKGHGRNGADAYTGAEQIRVPHESLQAGDSCPKCEKGTVYEWKYPEVLVRLVGQPPIGAKVYYLQKLRCGLCGVLFTAAPPAGVGDQKRDATVGSMIALLKYGSGTPFYREGKLQASLGIPLPASTQWGIVHDQAERAKPVFEEFIDQAANGDVLFNDDTTVKILEAMAERGRQAALVEEVVDAAADTAGDTPAEAAAMPTADADGVSAQQSKPERTGTFTSGIVATRDGRRIALFFSGHQHAGENLKDVLSRRGAELGAPIQMCDALSRNLPGELQTILANCLAHGRRRFVDVTDSFPEECRHVLESLAVVYKNDALAREQKLSPQARLELHQAESGPVMEELHTWLVRQFDQRLVEPNSALGGAIRYLLKHWAKLTLFLRVAGAPLDNNICERALKRAILHRKNALFYKTFRGARVGDIFMSLIHTCELCGANPFDYLTELDRHAAELSSRPQDWMPWNYRATLAALTSPSAALS